MLLENYRKVINYLEDFPEWRDKFESDISKLFAFSNTRFDAPEIYELINQQKIFK